MTTHDWYEPTGTPAQTTVAERGNMTDSQRRNPHIFGIGVAFSEDESPSLMEAWEHLNAPEVNLVRSPLAGISTTDTMQVDGKTYARVHVPNENLEKSKRVPDSVLMADVDGTQHVYGQYNSGVDGSVIPVQDMIRHAHAHLNYPVSALVFSHDMSKYIIEFRVGRNSVVGDDYAEYATLWGHVLTGNGVGLNNMAVPIRCTNAITGLNAQAKGNMFMPPRTNNLYEIIEGGLAFILDANQKLNQKFQQLARYRATTSIVDNLLAQVYKLPSPVLQKDEESDADYMERLLKYSERRKKILEKHNAVKHLFENGNGTTVQGNGQHTFYDWMQAVTEVETKHKIDPNRMLSQFVDGSRQRTIGRAFEVALDQTVTESKIRKQRDDAQQRGINLNWRG